MQREPPDLDLIKAIWSLHRLPWLESLFLREIFAFVEDAVDPAVLDGFALANAVHLLKQLHIALPVLDLPDRASLPS